jgi:hypothetical protein
LANIWGSAAWHATAEPARTFSGAGVSGVRKRLFTNSRGWSWSYNIFIPTKKCFSKKSGDFGHCVDNTSMLASSFQPSSWWHAYGAGTQKKK